MIIDGEKKMGQLYGLYIKLSRDGKIKRTLSAVKGKGKLKDTTIAEELMSFMKQEWLTVQAK